MEAIPQPDALVVMDDCNLKSVEAPDLEEGLDVRGRSYELSIWYSMLIPYLDLTLSYSHIAPPMPAYLRLVLILMFYDVLRCSIGLFVYVNSYHRHR